MIFKRQKSVHKHVLFFQIRFETCEIKVTKCKLKMFISDLFDRYQFNLYLKNGSFEEKVTEWFKEDKPEKL